MEVPDAPWPDDAVEVGRVLGAWGVKGWVRIQAFSPDPQALFSSRQWLLAPAVPSASGLPVAQRSSLLQRFKIRDVREHGDGIVAHFHEVDDRAAAEALRGRLVIVGRSSFPTPEADEYYWVDLIGCEVVNRQGERLGQVSELFATGPNSVMRVLDDQASQQPGAPANADVLIPFVAAYVDAVDLPGRRISVDWERGD